MSITRCFTFGSGHCEVLGVQFPAFVRITGPSAEWCRKEMFRRYKNKWAFDYSEEQIAEQQTQWPNLKEVPLGQLPAKRKSRL